MKRIVATAVAATALWLAGCSAADSYDNAPPIGPTDPSSGNGNPGGGSAPPQPAATAALFQPLQGILPFPTDIYFAGSTDGTLNIQPANALMPAQNALNALDGFSTTAPIRVRFGSPIDESSLTAATVRVIRVATDNATKAPGTPFQPLVFGVDFTVGLAPDAGVGDTILEIRPTRPLEPSTGGLNAPGTGYLVLLTNGIRTAAGSATADRDYQAFKTALASSPDCASIANATLNALCRLTGAHLQIGQAVGVDPASVVLSFSFTTQSIHDALAAVAAAATARPISVLPLGITTADVGLPGLQGKANVYAGTLQIPYFLSRTAPLTGAWQAAGAPPAPLDPSSRHVTRFNPLPEATETLTIPVLVTVPNAASASGGARPAAGWPIAIFQHGITGNRSQMFAIAESFADAGFVVVAIDLPLHGLPPTSPLYAPAVPPSAAAIERTFDLDLVNNQTGAAGADGEVDASGTHFINLASLLTSRDNLRQAAADIVTLAKSVPALELTGDATPDIDPTRIHFVGLSLGAIVGTLATAVSDEIVTATLAAPGGGVATLLRGSPAFGPRIVAGLQQQGLQPGTSLFEQFFRDAQTVVDAGDPWNFIAKAAAAHPIHLVQIVGGAGSPPDQVVPNFSTQRLIDAAQLTKISAPGVNLDTAGHRAYVNFVAGSHGSLLDPTASLAATVEMQRQTVTFASGAPLTPAPGTVIPITDPAVIEP